MYSFCKETIEYKNKSYQLVLELLLQLVKLGEVPDGRASQGGGVLNQDDLPAELGELELEIKGKS